MNNHFQLLLCTGNTNVIKLATEAGVDGIIVEWEAIELENNADLLLTSEKIEALKQVRCSTDAWIICRLNPSHTETKQEIETALALGADEIWLPKVRTIVEVEKVLEIVNQRCHLGIVIETLSAIQLVDSLSKLSLNRVHIGLNDLAESLKNPHSFLALCDGTVEKILQPFSIPYGFGGLTLPDLGFPISCRLLMGELIRLGCSFSLLRRSFLADTEPQNLKQAIFAIREGIQQSINRNTLEINQDQQELYQKIQNLNK
ncbi:hypothetical protein C7H19_16550 [Aphanothece hegewaldii CCALA 016]|uniref:Uncharacterized protein n=1 Tax=Aphanothece hegewaldii CCALA 016 TaxID=2107694 RepID=A0A2T1LUT7_9CHRO|nr:aldolase/citrate lyase family protein [Aphanothece hegewaldii]PSF35392.1 hypothetical protein C7H19_16550 [Aphanothece hegewaldii CCALA 016]